MTCFLYQVPKLSLDNELRVQVLVDLRVTKENAIFYMSTNVSFDLLCRLRHMRDSSQLSSFTSAAENLAEKALVKIGS